MGAGAPLSFVGRAVVSDGDHPNVAERAVNVAQPDIVPADTVALIPEAHATAIAITPDIAAVDTEAQPVAVTPPPEVEVMKKREPVVMRVRSITAETSPSGIVSPMENVSPQPIGATVNLRSMSIPKKPNKVSIKVESATPPSVTHMDPTIVKPSEPDHWDTLILGGTPDERSPLQHKNIIEGNRVTLSPYHPIVTSLDPNDHFDPAPLMPTLQAKSPSVNVSETRADKIKVVAQDIAPEIQKEIPIPETPQLKAEVLEPIQKPPLVSRIIIPIAPSSTLPPAVLSPVTVEPEPKALPALSIAPTVQAPIMVTQTEVLSKVLPPALRTYAPLVAKTQQSILTASNVLPMKQEEQHLSMGEPHPLMKHVGFNALFGVVLIGVGSLLFMGLNTTAHNALSALNNTGYYLASVGVAKGVQAIPDTTDESSSLAKKKFDLPFSDEVKLTPGADDHSILVRPIFKNSLGATYEYKIIPVASSTTAADNGSSVA